MPDQPTVSHELRSPLASIKGYAAALLRHERRPARTERHQFLLAMTEASDRLDRSIERLLEMAQLETGALLIERSPVNVALLAQEAITAAEQGLAEQAAGHSHPHMLELCVSDTGMGIPAGHLERIFEQFYRVDLRLTREVNGLGLGLAICKRIIELHEGTIWAESALQHGSTLHVLLPIGEVDNV